MTTLIQGGHMNIEVKISKEDFVAFHTEKFLFSNEFKKLLIVVYIYFFIIYILLLVFLKSVIFSILYFISLVILFKFRYIIFSKLIFKLLTKYIKKKGNQYLFETTNILLSDNFITITNIYRERTFKIKNINEVLSNNKLICIKFNTGDNILFPLNIEDSTKFISRILNITNLEIKKIYRRNKWK